jgi:hypothetical protein
MPLHVFKYQIWTQQIGQCSHRHLVKVYRDCWSSRLRLPCPYSLVKLNSHTDTTLLWVFVSCTQNTCSKSRILNFDCIYTFWIPRYIALCQWSREIECKNTIFLTLISHAVRPSNRQPLILHILILLPKITLLLKIKKLRI